ncbi:MarR family transcriptional regulator [Nitrospirillum amazonense]|uniref:MarR family transcriptional regulator n=1 Tax=Nitrospirillum amazonense TaxID=28077 RepID=A0A560FSL7_9PROT|nr:MarR family transcriptional regulator [Nitrospirillum amazonense]TWB24636.1 MarR family transcriptional regulator [Nitrospirillum amazonense]
MPALKNTTPAADVLIAEEGRDESLSATAKAETALDCSKLERFVGFNLSRAETLVRRLVLEHLAPCQLTLAEFSLLSLVSVNKGVNQRQAGEVLEIAPPNMAHLVDRLANRGLLKRVRGRQDRRVQMLSLSDAGLDLLAQAEGLVEEQEAKVSAVLTADEQTQLLALLNKIRTL